MARAERRHHQVGDETQGSDPFRPRDDDDLGEWLREELVEAFGVEDEPWAVELVCGVARRLNAARAPERALEPIILWMAGISAFIAPGRYVYLMRGLLHRVWREEMLAFVLAHEMAHHDLGHTRVLDGYAAWARRLPGLVGVVWLHTLAGRLVHGPEQEVAADMRALDLCAAAGYDGVRCVELFDLCEAYALELRDIDGAFGPESRPDGGAIGPARWAAEIRYRNWLRYRGYHPIRDRKEALLARLADRDAKPRAVEGVRDERHSIRSYESTAGGARAAGADADAEVAGAALRGSADG